MSSISIQPSFRTFLNAHRVEKGGEWNLTGMGGADKGCYKIEDAEYDTFLELFHDYVFKARGASSLLEKHRDTGPVLVDLDFRYESGGVLERRFNADHTKAFIAEYAAAMVFFSNVENLSHDLVFYSMVKPGPETDKGQHKDGIHIMCPTITTTPKYQYAIRGYLIGKGIIERVYGSTDVSNAADDVYDVSVIHRNNWFLYGACKPDKSRYAIDRVWTLRIEDVQEMLSDGGDPVNFEELVDLIQDCLTDSVPPTSALDVIKTLSIRRGHVAATPLSTRASRTSEWEELMIAWGSGKARQERVAATPRNIFEGAESETEGALILARPERGASAAAPDSPRGGAGASGGATEFATAAHDVELAYRLARECLNAERRAGDYSDWINLAICLKNIANSEESFKVWCELTRRVDSAHKKSRYTEGELRAKWALIRNNGDGPRLTIRSLMHWAQEDNPERHRSILSANNTDWIIHFGKDTHVSVASCVNRLYKYEFCCSVGARRGAYEWYHYPVTAHSWKHLRTATELRSRLSGQVKNEYVEASNECGRRHNATDVATEREMWDAKRKMLFGIERQLEMSSFKDNVLKECQEKFYDEEFLSKLNCNPFLVGVANGVLDLNYYDNDSRTGRPRVVHRPGLPDDYISFQMGRSEPDLEPISYIPYDASSPEQRELASFFEKIYPDPVLREYVLTLLASCLEGQNKEQRFYVNQGGGSNGKSMIQILMEFTFGDYQTSLQTTVLTRKRPESGAANPDMITTKCKRYIYMGEPDGGEKLNTSRMKQLSGEDRVEARGLFSDQEKFTMMGKIFLSCNDLPPVSSMDNGTWRRIRVIPHISTFKDPGDPAIDPSKHIYEKDLHLKSKLRYWRTAFLSLLVHYYETQYLVHGLREPEIVVSASNKYKEENDMFSSFFAEHFVKETGAGPVTAKEVKAVFRAWKKELGRSCDLKEGQVLERMKAACGGRSTEKEFYDVRIVDGGGDGGSSFEGS